MATPLHKEAFLRGALQAVRKYAPVAGAKLVKGTGGEMRRQALSGAALGGLVEGGLNAIGAEEGQRGQAFLHGAAQGAAFGGLTGGLSGMVTAPARNLRRGGLSRMYGADVAENAMKSSWGGNVKGIFGRGDRSIPRGAHAFEALAAPATLAAEGHIPFAIMGAASAAHQNLTGGPQQAYAGPQQAYAGPQQAYAGPQQAYAGPQQTPGGYVRTAAARGLESPLEALEDSKAEETPPDPFFVTPFTSLTGAIAADKAVAKFHPKMPAGALRNRVIPSLGAAAVTLPVLKVMRAQREQEIDPMSEIDFEALKHYFGKQPATP